MADSSKRSLLPTFWLLPYLMLLASVLAEEGDISQPAIIQPGLDCENMESSGHTSSRQGKVLHYKLKASLVVGLIVGYERLKVEGKIASR